LTSTTVSGLGTGCGTRSFPLNAKAFRRSKRPRLRNSPPATVAEARGSARRDAGCNLDDLNAQLDHWLATVANVDALLGGLGTAERDVFSLRSGRRVFRRAGSPRAEARRNRSPRCLRGTMSRVPSLPE